MRPIALASRGLFVAVLAFCPSLCPSVRLSAQSTSLTIYSDGRVLQRRVLPVAVPAGPSTLRAALGEIDPGSLFALDPDVAVTGAVYDAALDEANTLRRAIGRQLAFLALGPNGRRDTVTAEVAGMDPERYRLADGRITYQRPGAPLFPANLVLDEPSVTLSLRSGRAHRSLGLGFFSAGASWTAAYAVTLSGATARITGHAVIQSGRLRADSAEIQLLAGNVGRAGETALAGAPTPMLKRAAAEGFVATEQAVGEAHLYSVPGRVSLAPGLAVTVALFEPALAPVDRRYVVRGWLPYRGPIPQYGDESQEPVGVTYTVRRSGQAGFARVPIPGGTVRIYQPDDGDRPQLIAEGSVGHTAPGQDLVLDAGSAFDLTARRTQTAYSTRRDSLRTIAFASYRVTLANARDSAVTVEVLEQRAGEWEVVSSSVPAERPSSTTARFRVRVPAAGEATLTYRIRAVW